MDALNEKKVIPDSLVNSIQTFQRLFQYFLSKWWIILIAGIVGGGLGILYATMQKPKYESRLTFALDEGGSNTGMSGAAALAAQFGFSAGGRNDVFAGDNIIEIIRSRRIVETILLSPDSSTKPAMTMVERYLLFSEMRKTFDKNPRLQNVRFPIGQSRSNFSRLQDSILYTVYADFVKTNITVGRPDKKLNIIEVKVMSGQEDFSKMFTERLVAEANNFYTEIRSKKSRHTLEVLEERINTLKGGLNSSIGSRAATQDANVNASYAQAQVPIQKQQVNIQVYSGAYAEMFKNLEIARFQYLNEMPLMQIIDKPDYPMKKIKKGRLLTGIIGAIILSILVSFFLLIRYYVSMYKNYIAALKPQRL